MAEVTISIGGVDLWCECVYNRGSSGGGLLPPEPPEFYVDEVRLGDSKGPDLTALIQALDVVDIVDDKAYDKYKQENINDL